MRDKFYKNMFLVGAIWNLAGGAIIVILTNWIFAIANLTPPFPPVYYYSWIALFVTFGIGYYMAYQDMYGNKNIILLGAIGKLAFAVIFIYYMVSLPGQIPFLFIIPVIGDIIFAILFLMFLNFARSTSR
jgi:hypothetical protein